VQHFVLRTYVSSEGIACQAPRAGHEFTAPLSGKYMTIDMIEVESANLCGLLRSQVAAREDWTAYEFLSDDLEVAQALTYGELGHAAESIADCLAIHTRPGDRVLLAFNNNLDAVRLFWGCIVAGVVPVPAPAPDPQNAKASQSRLQGIVADARVKIALTVPNLLAAARAQAPETPWLSLQELLSAKPLDDGVALGGDEANVGAVRDLAYLQYTSGSTSQPRGVEITHMNVLAQCRALVEAEALDPDRLRALIWLPWFHDYGLIHGLIQPLYAGGTSILMSTVHFLLRPLKWLEAIDRHRVTHSGAPDFAYAACVQALSRAPNWTGRLDSWQLASCGAEPVRATTLDAFANAFSTHGFDGAAFAPSYGLAEAVLAVTVRTSITPLRRLTLDAQALDRHEVVEVPATAKGARTMVGCGPALTGFDLRIVDPETFRPCVHGHIGEIWVAGPSVGRGYWNQREETAAHFAASFEGQTDRTTHYLRTGDLGFLWRDELFITGRRKDLILVHGRNIYPQDLELTAEMAHSTVRQAGVIAISVDKGSRESVVMLVECSRRPTPDVVRDLLDNVNKQIAMAHHIDLHEVVPLRAGSLPRTSSGKPRRSAARQLYLQGALEPMRLEARSPASDTLDDAAPDAALIETIAGLWREVLGLDDVGLDTDFFGLGGDSLLATQLVSRVKIRLGIELPIRSLFEAPTVRGLARQAAKALSRQTGLVDGTVGQEMVKLDAPQSPRRSGDQVPLSFSQERMWFMHAIAPESSAYNIPLALKLRGLLDLKALQWAWDQVVERHEILRTRFINTADGPAGEVMPAQAWPLEAAWLETHDGSDPDETLARHLADVCARPFQLDQCPLFRVHVVGTGEREAVLLIVMHHIIGDQWSFAALGQELAYHYNAAKVGTEVPVPALPIQYADYAAWHRTWFSGERQARELAYWLHRLEGLEPLSLNTDFPRPGQHSFQGASLRLPLAPSHIASLRALGAANGTSLSMVLIAALNVLLMRHTGKTDIAIGVPIANRHQLASENLIGTFVNTLVFRTDLGGSPDFKTVLSRVREVALEAFAHQDMPFEVLVRKLGTRSDPGMQPLFSVMFNMVNTLARDCVFDGMTWSRLDFDRASAQFDLTVIADAVYDGSIVLEYATDLFEPETVRRMGEHLLRILHAAVDTLDHPVTTLPMLSDSELSLLNAWSLGPRTEATRHTVNECMSHGARLAPQDTAIELGQHRLTHCELDEASNRLAHVLRQRGVARNTRVGLCLPRSTNLVVALLAILKAGATYVPLDPEYPRQRLIFQITDADMALMITESAMSARLACDSLPILLLDTDHHLMASAASNPLQPDITRDARPEDAAYLIYTSGSTGQPKGVEVPHRAVANFLTSMASAPGLTKEDRLLAVTTISFDIAVLEIFLPLAAGGTVVIASEAQATDGSALAQLITTHGITAMQATPSRWHLLLESGWQGQPDLKALVGGEALTPSLASQLLDRCGEVWNMYGPTETTVWSSCWRVEPDKLQRISLGQPIANTSIQVLDAQLNPCPVGVTGEIYLGGTGVALGYFRRTDLTAERFIDQPAAAFSENARLYRTGDLGHWRHDGSLEHCGRMDDQIKLRGFRLELGEIEANLLSHPNVERALVMLREDVPGQARLVAYIVPHGQMPTREQLRQHLRQWLPDHMVPAHFLKLDAIPLLPNGKTHRRALPAPTETRAESSERLPPRNPTEQAIWSAWQETLELEDFGVHDNFFDLGGHSILAVRVVSRIETVLHRPCPLGLLFERPTVAELAEALAPEEGTVDVPMAVLQARGKSPNFFLLAGAEMYREFAQLLPSDMPVFGVFSPVEIKLLELAATEAAPPVTVELLAAEYLALILDKQAQGPYYLGGFSIGGVLAYEVARQLKESGQEVGLVVMLDSMLPGRGWRHLVSGIRRRVRLIRQQGFDHLLHIYKIFKHETVHRHEPGSRRNQIYVQAIRAYKVTPCDMPMVFLQSSEDPASEPAYGWRSLVPGLIAERVPGKHMHILEQPNVVTLAARVRAHIAAARQATRST
jgi:amino acid adenylation domain-containing protein